MFWNTTLLPVITLLNLASSILIRRTFGLESGIYDILIGITNTMLTYSSLGISASFPKLISDLGATVGPQASMKFVRRAGLLRILLLVIPVLLLNVMAVRLATTFQLGEHGTFLLQAVTVLTLGRAVMDMVNRTLQGTLAHRSANLLRILQTSAVTVLIVFVIVFGGGIGNVVIGMGVITILIAGLGIRVATSVLHNHRGEFRRTLKRKIGEFSPGLSTSRFLKFALFLYVLSISGYFSQPDFASPVLAVVAGGIQAVAIFNTAYLIPQTIVVLILSSFQGLYVPMFARLLTTPDNLRTAYKEISKVQAILLIPAASGLIVMFGDYIPLIYGQEFVSAVPIARILTVALFVEAFLSLGGILLTTAELARPVMLSQALVVLGAGPFVLAASTGNLVLTAAIFPVGRLLSALVRHLVARKKFGVQFPWTFIFRAALPSISMVAILIPLRSFGESGWLEVVFHTALGFIIVLIGMRVFRVLGPRELDLLERAKVPGVAWIFFFLGRR
jgi:O-antigen/teichoic acid export membrane protein